MALIVYKLHPQQLQHFLRGALLGTKVEGQRGLELSFEGLFNKTLIFTDPLVTVTFALPASGLDVYPFQEIKAQIETQEPLLLVTKLWGQLVLTRKIVTTGVNLNNLGTANSILGFSTTAPTIGKVYDPPGGAAPRLINAVQLWGGMLQVVVEE